MAILFTLQSYGMQYDIDFLLFELNKSINIILIY
jgi:hypothetical protein